MCNLVDKYKHPRQKVNTHIQSYTASHSHRKQISSQVYLLLRESQILTKKKTKLLLHSVRSQTLKFNASFQLT